MGATLFGAPSPRSAEDGGSRLRENLAFAYQNVITVIVRLRAQRQTIASASAFRQQIKNALAQAEKDVKNLYPHEDVRLATFAMVAFLDESILSSNAQIFSDWVRKPLQEEMFGTARAGEVFFQNIELLLARGDSNAVADLLEVYLLCILLGYKGRYGLLGDVSVRPVADAISDKIRRIRGPLSGFSPAWEVPEGTIPTTANDPWLRFLGLAALITCGIAVILFFLFRFLQANGLSSIHSLAIYLPASVTF